MLTRTAVGVVALILLNGGCAAQEQPVQGSKAEASSTAPVATASTSSTASPYRRFAMGDAYEIEHFDSAKELVTKADVVVVGTVTGAHWGHEYRDVETDASGTDVELARELVFEVGVDEVIEGHPVGQSRGTVDVVIDVVDPPFTLDPPIGEQSAFILRRVGAPIPGINPDAVPKLLEQRIYRPVSSLGILDEDRGHMAFVLGGGDSWTRNLLELSWDDAIDKLVSLARN